MKLNLYIEKDLATEWALTLPIESFEVKQLDGVTYLLFDGDYRGTFLLFSGKRDE